MPNYSIGWVHREICARLMRFYTDVMERKSPRLILTMPPRHGKSQLVSKHFPAWCFGVNPDISFMACSYSDGLSRRVNKDVQRIMESNEYHRIFPRTTLPPRGSKYTRSTNLIEMIWDWYTSTAYTRLSPGGGVLVTLTRWHEDDLAGRLLNAMKQGDGDQWTVINYPAIAEKDEPHRKIGEALHPERYPLEMLEKIRINVGSYDWNALYQQHPAPVGGSIIKREWLQQYEILPKVFDKIIQSWCAKMDFVSSIRAFQRMSEKHPKAIRKIIEDKANGPAIISALRNKISGIVPFTPQGSKEARAFAVSPLFEAGNVYIPKQDAEHPWVRDYIDELVSFPSAPHDDRVDSTTQALNYLATGMGTGLISFI